MPERTCSLAGCGGRHVARGMCNPHYQRWYKHGDPLATGRTPLPMPERFWSKADKSPDDGCWVWTSWIQPNGYGYFWLDGARYAHRVAYEIAVGPIPAGLVIDHLCANKSCVNPAHLEVVTIGENTRRARAAAARLADDHFHNAWGLEA